MLGTQDPTEGPGRKLKTGKISDHNEAVEHACCLQLQKKNLKRYIKMSFSEIFKNLYMSKVSPE